MHNSTFCSTFLLIFFIAGFQFSASAQPTNRSSKIKSIVGTADIRRTGTINWVKARANMPIKERDALRTYIESELEIETSEGTIIKLGENSTLEIDKFNAKEQTENTRIKILNGNIIANVKKLVNTDSKFEFETPTATAAIRGTVVGFEVNKEKTVVKVFEGIVVVTPNGARKGVEIKENQMTSVAKGQKSVSIEKLEEKPTTISPEKKTGLIDSTKSDTLKTVYDTISTPDTVTQKQSATVSDTLVKKAGIAEIEDPTSKNTELEDVDNEITEPKIVTTTNADSVKATSTEIKQPIRLNVSLPADRSEVRPGAQVSVAGTVLPVTANLTINGKTISVSSSGQFKTTLTASAQPSDFEISISAEAKGSTQTITRTVIVKALQLNFDVKSPGDGQVFTKTTIPVSGIASPGAEVTVMSIRIPVSASGTFSGQVPIPNEDGEIILEFEASLDGKFANISRKIIYQPEYRFNLITPLANQTVSTTSIQIKGEVLPVGSKVSVMGRPLNVTPTGIFSGTVLIPEEEGEIELDFDITYGSMSKNETRTVTYKKPLDIARPEIQTVLPQISETNQISVAIYDRTPGDEITLTYTIDGAKETEKGAPNSSFTVPLQSGIHAYTLQATDKAGNTSQMLSQNITWFGTIDWMIKINKAVDVLYLPPSGPGNNYEPVYTLEFSIENLPDNDMRLISLVTVVNKLTGETYTKKTYTDNYFTVDMKLKNHATNNFDISIEDIRKKIKTRTIQVVVK
jgi:hypothetical protein